MDRIAVLASWHTPLLAGFAGNARFVNARQLGTIAAVDVVVSDAGYLANVGLAMRKACLERGVLLRPLGNTVYMMPPYCTTHAELRAVYAVVSDIVAEVCA